MYQHFNITIQYWGINVKRFDVSLILFVIILYNVSLSVLTSITFNVAKNNQINVAEFGQVCVQFIHISPLIFPANSTYFNEYCILESSRSKKNKKTFFVFVFSSFTIVFSTKVTKLLYLLICVCISFKSQTNHFYCAQS